MSPMTLREKPARTILNPANGFIGEYDYTLNPYAGCAFGCGYCYAAAFTQKNAPAGASWGRWVDVKTNAPLLAQQAVSRKELDGKTVYMSSVTDPWQPAEKTHRVTRRILQAMAKARNFGLTLQTRSPMVAEDLEYIAAVAQGEGNEIQVNVTVSTDDEEVRRVIEATCPPTEARVEALEIIAQANVENLHACFTLTPLLPLRDLKGFAQRLLATGVRRFIIQETHDTTPSAIGNLKAVTRDTLPEQLARLYGIPVERVHARYRREYEENARILTAELTRDPDMKLGFGRKGFGLPFENRTGWHSPRNRPEYTKATSRNWR